MLLQMHSIFSSNAHLSATPESTDVAESSSCNDGQGLERRVRAKRERKAHLKAARDELEEEPPGCPRFIVAQGGGWAAQSPPAVQGTALVRAARAYARCARVSSHRELTRN